MARQRGGGDLPRLDPARPKSEQIREVLKELADSQQTGSPIPSERVLSARFRVARMTVRQCLDELEVEGIVRRVPGRGTFVAEPTAVRSDMFGSFSEDMRARGLHPGTTRLRVQTRAATGELARSLGLTVGDKVYTVERVRTADGAPMAVTRTHLSAQRFIGLDQLLDADSSLYVVLAKHFAVRPDNAEERIAVATLSKRDAVLLGVEPGSPALQVDRVARDSAGDAVEASRSTYRADQYVLHLHLERPRRG